ncbi:hypothetical protein [Vagococcus lutrae]|uniref:hypothetical protein n=1 Tax=Vagococcus lutrae TaxID=81947 RepID=UPI00288DC685|nr:hypothetical protein [Vagococcus lutrae]MDT2843019.1 hypothetical protein [Vagococcus lutrae]
MTFILKEYIEDQTGGCIIPTLCEKVMLYESLEDVIHAIYESSDNLIRFLDINTMLPLEDLYDPYYLSEEDFSEEALEALLEENNEWEEYSENYPLETSRQFLSTDHYGRIVQLFTAIKKNERPGIHDQLFKYFSEEDQLYLIKEKDVIIHRAKLDKIQKMTSKGKFATSFFKWYKNGKEINIDNICELKQEILRLGLQGTHTGFAIGKIEKNMGIIEFDGEESKSSFKHMSFWKFRDSDDYIKLIENFTFYDF